MGKGVNMSSIDGNGKGNLLISYLFKSKNVVKQVEEEAALKVLISNLLSTVRIVDKN